MEQQEVNYTYNIKNIVINKKYIGVRTCVGDPDIGIRYFSSSHDKDFMQDQKDNPQNYTYEVSGIFITRELADEYEMYLHAKFDVATSDEYYNLSNITSLGFSTGFGSKHRNALKVLQINQNTGEIIKEWGCISQAERYLGITSIGNCARGKGNGKSKAAGGFVWLFLKDYTPKRKQEIMDKTYCHTGHILQINKDTGEIIREWSSSREAEQALGINAVSSIARGVGVLKTAGGFVWVYPEDYTIERRREIINMIYDYTGHILQINKDTGEIIREWSSCSEVKRKLGLFDTGKCAKGILKTVGGFVWVYPEDYTLERKQAILFTKFRQYFLDK